MEKLHVQQSRWWDWAAVGLLFVLLQTVASRLVATTWTPFLYLIQTFTYIGFVVGIALGYSQFRRGTVRLLTFIYMLLMLPLEWTLIIDQHASLEEQFASVAGRLFFSASDFFARQPVEDPIFFVALMSITFWIISSWAGYTLVRNQNYLGSVLPAAIGLIIIQNYDNGIAGRLWFLAFFAFIALLLLGRLQYLQNKSSWRARRIFLSPDNSVDLTSSMAIAAGLIIHRRLDRPSFPDQYEVCCQDLESDHATLASIHRQNGKRRQRSGISKRRDARSILWLTTRPGTRIPTVGPGDV